MKRTAGIWLLAAAAAGTAVIVLVSARDLPGPLRTLAVPWWALALGFFLAECAVVHLHIRRETHTLSLSEVPLVLGLFAVTPLGLVTAQLAGMGAALVFYRHQRPLKVVFNLAQSALATAVAVFIFRSIVDGGDAFQPGGWLAGLAAASIAAATGVVLVAGAVSLAGERPTASGLTTTTAVSFMGTLTAGSLALAGAVMADLRPSAVALLLLPDRCLRPRPARLRPPAAGPRPRPIALRLDAPPRRRVRARLGRPPAPARRAAAAPRRVRRDPRPARRSTRDAAPQRPGRDA